MGWYDSGWSYRKEVTIDNTSNSNNLTDYQVKVTLNSTNFDFSKAKSDGADIRFTDDDGTTLLNHWIEKWDASGEEAILWVKVPSIPASSNKTIYLYYGNSNASSTSSVTNTFIREITGIVGSWHINEGSGNVAHDTSGNGRDGTISGTINWVNNELNFSGSDTKILIDSFNVSQISIEARIKPDVLSGVKRIVTKYPGSGNGDGYILLDVINDDDLRFNMHNASWQSAIGSNVVTTDEQHVVGTFDGDVIRVYRNKTEVGSNDVSFTSIPSNSTKWCIGEDATEGSNPEYFDGVIKDVRIYDRALTLEEISDLNDYYGYTTTNYPGKVLVRKRSDPEPSTTVGNEEANFYISGQITLNGNPVQGAIVRAICQDDETYAGDTTTDENGNYSITNLKGTKKYHIVVEYTDGSGHKYNAESKWDITPLEGS